MFASADLPVEQERFRSSYGESLVRFEAARAASPERTEIARRILCSAERRTRFVSAIGELAADEYWSEHATPLPLEGSRTPPPSRLQLEIPFEGRRFRGKELHELADLLTGRRFATQATADALHWIADYGEEHGGVDLQGHKFAILGAGAELAATPLLQAAGASVLWIDIAEPSSEVAGTRYVPGGADLLRQPREIAATIRAFAGDAPVHLALYAYAGGGGREWRLAAAMNGIVRTLDPEVVRSVTLLISPTSPILVQPEDRAAAERYRGPWWQAPLARALRMPSNPLEGESPIARAIVSIQGPSYQGAQYVAKILTAEAWAAFGSRLDPQARTPLTVSANIAGVSRTRSLTHPVFEAAFAGAHVYGVASFDPATTRALNAALTLHDLLNPNPPPLFTQQVHGGVYAVPWALNPCINVAAAIGMVRRPTRLVSVLRGR